MGCVWDNLDTSLAILVINFIIVFKLFRISSISPCILSLLISQGGGGDGEEFLLDILWFRRWTMVFGCCEQ